MANRLFVPQFAEAPMPRLSAEPIVMTAPQEQLLTRLVRAHTTPRKLAERAQMILLAAAGTGVRESARQLGVWPKTVRHWLARWRSAAEAVPVAERLADAPRAGRTGDIHARADLRDCRIGLRATGGGERSASEPLEPQRTGPMCGRTWHR